MAAEAHLLLAGVGDYCPTTPEHGTVGKDRRVRTAGATSASSCEGLRLAARGLLLATSGGISQPQRRSGVPV